MYSVHFYRKHTRSHLKSDTKSTRIFELSKFDYLIRNNTEISRYYTGIEVRIDTDRIIDSTVSAGRRPIAFGDKTTSGHHIIVSRISGKCKRKLLSHRIAGEIVLSGSDERAFEYCIIIEMQMAVIVIYAGEFATDMV